MIRVAMFVIAVLANVSLPALTSAQATRYPLTSTNDLRLHNVVAQPAALHGKQGVRVVVAPDVVERQTQVELLALIEGLEFSNGIIEVELAGTPASGTGAGARGFVGIAFRLQPDMQTYDAIYLRPTNGRAEDQERRNHATQYISHPDWTWSRLRRETPSKYESYVDLVADTWTKFRIEVRGAQARLFVHDQPQPVLIVNDLKSGATRAGAVALWIGPGTVAHFRSLTVTGAEPR